MPTRSAARLRRGLVGAGGNTVSLAAGYELSHYDFTVSDNRDFRALFVAASLDGMITENWAARVSLTAGTGAEDSANFDDGSWYGGGLRFEREWDGGFAFGLGLELHGLPERGLQLNVPVSFKWRINERWKLELRDGLSLAWDVGGDQRTVFELGYVGEYRHYRMRDFAEPGLLDLAVGELQRVAVVKLHHRFDNGAFLTASAGYTGDREITYWHDRTALDSADGEQVFVFTFGGGWRW